MKCAAALFFLGVCTLVHAQTTILFEAVERTNLAARIDAKAGAPGTSKLTLTLLNGEQDFQVDVLQRGNTTDALAAQKARTGWKENYLFVRDDCLAPNDAKRPWRCVVERVFTFVEGRDRRRLAYIGEVYAGDDCAEEAKFGCSMYDDLFTDVYDKLENNALAPHEESPALLLEMRVKAGEFVVDLDETWGRNQERFHAGNRCLAAPAAERVAACSDGISPRRAYLFNATLATYTKRNDRLMRIHSYARAALCGEQANARASDSAKENTNDDECREKLRLSALMFASISPGERPRPRGGVSMARNLAGKDQ